MQRLLLFLSLIAVNNVFAQIIIRGKVFDHETYKALAGASVYINNSTAGTFTNAEGNFSLTINQTGFIELIVTYVGYETAIYKMEVKNQNPSLQFRLQPKAKELKNVLVLTNDTRKKWLKLFRENFVGVTTAALRTSILNEYDIQFEAGEEKGVIKAFSDEPLTIINKELGYKIIFTLKEFYYNPDQRRTYFLGFSKFEELKERGKVSNRYIKRRKAYYTGSIMHFLRSLVRSELEKEGFDLRVLQKMYLDSSKVNDVSMSGPRSKVSANFRYVSFPMAGDSVFQKNESDGNINYHLAWNGRLQVYFKGEPPFKAALSKKVPFMVGGKGTTSYIDLLESPAIMDMKGIIKNPLAIQYSGFWAYEKLANMLPIDFTFN